MKMAIHVPIILPQLVEALPVPIVAALSRISRDDLALIVDAAIALLDDADGDPDVELNGDELDDNADREDDKSDWEPGTWLERGPGYEGLQGNNPNEDDEEDDMRAARTPYVQRARRDLLEQGNVERDVQRTSWGYRVAGAALDLPPTFAAVDLKM